MPSARARLSVVDGAPARGLERRRDMVRLFRVGYSVADLAKRFGVRPTYVEGVLREAWRAERWKREAILGAGTRLANIAFNLKQRARTADYDRSMLEAAQTAWDKVVRDG